LYFCSQRWSGLGSVNRECLSSSRLLFAGAKDGLFQRFFVKSIPNFTTPFGCDYLCSCLIFIFSVSGGFKQLAILASGALLLIYLAVILSLIKLRMKKNAGEENHLSCLADS